MADPLLVEGDIKSFETLVKNEMTKVIKHLEHDLASIRTGRAHPSMVEDLKVECYGGTTEMALRNIATVSAPDASMLVIQPWDQSTMGDIERALKESDLGITPQNDGSVIRLKMPEMSSARRDELIKVLGKKIEDNRISVRNVRKTYHNLIRDTEKGKKISEDFAKRLDDNLQKTTDSYIKQIDVMNDKKTAELKG